MSSRSAAGHEPASGEYAGWTHDELVKRVMHLEGRLRSNSEAATVLKPSPDESDAETLLKKPKVKKIFDPTKYSTRRIALKVAYLGGRYNGFEHHVNNTTPKTTIEEELWRALMKARLIFPEERPAHDFTGDTAASPRIKQHWDGAVNWNGCEYSKCGRTDSGVSAFGQVIALRARSNRPQEIVEKSTASQVTQEDAEQPSRAESMQRPFNDVKDELNYPSILNHLLPPDIRILAWCPAPTDSFSARFSCKERRYKYFFTQPATLPIPTAGSQTAFLDIERMRKAAGYLIGAHDFRNFCKVDPSKQITNFVRRITHASVDRVSTPDQPSFTSTFPFSRPDAVAETSMEVFTLSLHGTAFLWHQVRCIMAVLLLVGQRLEEPEVILKMLDTTDRSKGRPKYEMANEIPLVLWDCIFPLRPGDDEGKPYETGEQIEDAVSWMYTSDSFLSPGGSPEPWNDAHWGRRGLMAGLWSMWRSRKMDEILAASLMDKAAQAGLPLSPVAGGVGRSTLVVDGGDAARAVGKYVPLMRRERMDPVDVINERYAVKSGLERAAARSKSDLEVDE